MSAYFVDTSALAKRYLTEIGSVWVQNWFTQPNHPLIILSELAATELTMAFTRSHRQGAIGQADLTLLLKSLRFHFKQEYEIIKLRSRVLNTAQKLALKHPLRTLDAIQLSSAIMARQSLQYPITFISADTTLLSIATVEGFATDNPTLHP